MSKRISIPLSPAWPNDCPDCGTTMEFVFARLSQPQLGAAAAVRKCGECGRVVTARQVIGGEVVTRVARRRRKNTQPEPVEA